MIPGIVAAARAPQTRVTLAATGIATGAPVLGQPAVSAGAALTLVIVYDVDNRSMVTNAGLGASDQNGDGRSGTALDVALRRTVDLATALVGAGRGDQTIFLQPSGWSGVRATTQVTAAQIEAARVAGNLASTVFASIGTSPDRPLFHAPTSLFGDTIDTALALTGARATIAANPAAAKKIIFTCVRDGQSPAIAAAPSANRPAGSFLNGGLWFKSDPTSVLAGLASDGVDIDVVYYEAGANRSGSAVLAAIDSDGTIDVVTSGLGPDFATFLPGGSV